MPSPSALIITTAGINCDGELARAFELAGAFPESIHLNTLIEDPSLIERFDLIGVPGGFSYGDAIAAGRVMAQLMRQHLFSAFVSAIERGVPIFAPCNGFQIMCQMGLLPGPADGQPWPTSPPTPTASLGDNQHGRFVDCWSRVEVPASKCIWTRDLAGNEETMRLPCAHGEGRFVVDDPSIITTLGDNGQTALRYHSDDNFNGSTDRIAGICDRTGLVFGLMPHPERYTRWTQHPFWTRLDEVGQVSDLSSAEVGQVSDLSGNCPEPPGLQMFRNAVAYVMSSVGCPANAQSPAVANLS